MNPSLPRRNSNRWCCPMHYQWRRRSLPHFPYHYRRIPRLNLPSDHHSFRLDSFLFLTFSTRKSSSQAICQSSQGTVSAFPYNRSHTSTCISGRLDEPFWIFILCVFRFFHIDSMWLPFGTLDSLLIFIQKGEETKPAVITVKGQANNIVNTVVISLVLG